MTDATVDSTKLSVPEKLGAELGRKLNVIYKNVSGQTKQEALEKVRLERESAEADMQKALFTITRCYYNAKTEDGDTLENKEEFSRAVIFYHRGWNKTVNSIERQCQTYIGMGTDVVRALSKNGAVGEGDYKDMVDKVTNVYTYYDGPARKKIHNYENPGSIAEGVEHQKTRKPGILEPRN